MFLIKAKNTGILNVFRVFLTQSKGKSANFNHGSDYPLLPKREICNDGGAIFFSTHVLEVAEKLCDRVAIIKNGNLVMSGTVEDVKGDSSLEDVFLELEDNNA